MNVGLHHLQIGLGASNIHWLEELDVIIRMVTFILMDFYLPGLRCILRWPLWCKRKQDNHKIICWRKMENRNVNCWCSVAKLCPTLLWLHGLIPFRLLCPLVFPGKNPGVGCHFLLQGIFLTQGLNPCLMHWRADFLRLNQQRGSKNVNRSLHFN